MSAPFILKVREELGLPAEDAAKLLQIPLKDYLEKETNKNNHFDKDQLIILWNWMTPKMIDFDYFVNLLNDN